MKLYDYLPSGNSYKVRLLLSYLRLEYEHAGLDIIKGEAQTEAYRAINPAGQIPLLELADGRRIAESNAILYFLAEGTPYWPNACNGCFLNNINMSPRSQWRVLSVLMI